MALSNPYEILGVASTATPEEIKIAYRCAAQKHHPDKNEGDDELFIEIKLAYETLINPERRQLYDRTGVYERHQKVDNTRQIFVQLFLMVMGNGLDVIHENIIDRMRTTAREKIKEIDNADKDLLREGDRLDEAMERLSNPSGENILEDVIKSKLDAINNAIDRNEVERQTVLNVLDMLDDYEYRPDVVEPITQEDMHGYQTYNSGIQWGSSTA